LTRVSHALNHSFRIKKDFFDKELLLMRGIIGGLFFLVKAYYVLVGGHEYE